MCSFLFINKHAKNLDAKDHLQNANSHAQTVTWRKRRQHHVPRKGPVVRSSFYRVPHSHRVQDVKEREGGDKFLDPAYRLGRVATGIQESTPNSSTSDPSSDLRLADELDPFFQLSPETGLKDRRLLHFYFFEAARTLYGHPSSSTYCPLRDRTALFVQSSGVWLQWVLISAEVFKVGRVAATESQAILSRRALLYRSMRELLVHSPYKYETLAHITMAAVTEDRIGSTFEAQKHLTASRRLLHESGNHKISVPITTFSVLLYVGTGLEAFATQKTLHSAINSFMAAILTFQELQFNTWSGHLVRLRTAAPDASTLESLEFFRQFVLTSQEAYETDSPSPLPPENVDPSGRMHNEEWRQARARMAVIWILNRILYDLHYQGDNSSMDFLTGLRRLIGYCKAAEIKPITMLLGCLDYMGRTGFKQRLRRDVAAMDSIESDGPGDRRLSWWWECVDAVEALSLLPDDKRTRILRLCCFWLASAEKRPAALTAAECADFGQEIMLSWLMN